MGRDSIESLARSSVCVVVVWAVGRSLATGLEPGEASRMVETCGHHSLSGVGGVASVARFLEFFSF